MRDLTLVCGPSMQGWSDPFVEVMGGYIRLVSMRRRGVTKKVLLPVQEFHRLVALGMTERQIIEDFLRLPWPLRLPKSKEISRVRSVRRYKSDSSYTLVDKSVALKNTDAAHSVYADAGHASDSGG